MLHDISETTFYNSMKKISTGYLDNKTKSICTVLLAIILSSYFFAARALEYNSEDIELIEQKVMSWLKYQQNQNQVLMAKKAYYPAPTASDLRILAKYWSGLSSEFKNAYLELQEIPSNFVKYTTPRFGVEIYYTSSGADSVDITDTLSPSAENCCKFIVKPNGIPDYIDFTAGALDSAWQMEIVKLGYPAPKPYISSIHSSSAFKVVLKTLSNNYYGLTFPLGSQNDSSSGISSIITMRNNWSGWDIGGLIDYQTNPWKAIQISCAHELYHAIQYRMVHKVTDKIHLEDLPDSWIEGTAIMMEELVFPEINDYLQYVSPYFTNPSTFSVFGSATDKSSFSNVLVCLYLCGNLASGSSMAGFITSVFIDNMITPSSFDQLLSTASAKANRTWAEILNAFHTASYFTGQRSVVGRFLNDAPKMPEWTYTRGEGTLSGIVEKTVKPFSMQCCSFINNDHTNEALTARIIFSNSNSRGNYAGQMILRNSANIDSVIKFVPGLSDTGIVTVQKWSQWDEALVIVSNGTDSTNLTVKFQFSNDIPTNLPHKRSLNPVYPQQSSFLTRLDGRIVCSQQRKSNILHQTCTSSGIYITKDARRGTLIFTGQ